MASTNLKTLTGANQKKHAVADNAAVRALFLESSGVLWSSEYLVARGADAHVYKQDRDGKLASTVLVPYPKRAPKTATRSAPSIHGLLVENGTLWVSEYQYGMIYRYATNTAGANGTAAIFYEAPPQSGQPAESSTAQYGAMAFQPPEPSGKPVLWVLDTRGKLAGFDASQVSVTAPLYSIPVGVRAQSVDSLVYHAKTKTLWMVVEKTDNQFFLAMLPIQTPTADKLKYYALQDAQALALDGDLLYVGGTQGQIWQVPIETALAASSLGAAATPIITLKGDDGSAAVIFGLAVDKAGGVWATEISAKSHVYGVTPPNGAQQAFVQVTYQLLQTPQSKLASLAWRPPSGAGTKDEALLIADRARNGQVICISPLPGLLPIGPDGKPAYTLEFAPKEGYAFQNEDFGAAEKPPGIKLHAHPSGKPAEYLGGFVSLSVSGTPHVRLTGTSDQRETLPSATPALSITDLHVAADAVEGEESVLTAIGRGKPAPQATFRGHVRRQLQELNFDLRDVRVTAQGEAFALPHKDVKIVSTPNSTSEVKATIDGPKPSKGTIQEGDAAHFNVLAGKEVPLHVGDKLPVVMAGKLAGSVTITLSSTPAPKSAPALAWKVVARPTNIVPPSSPNYERDRAQESMAENHYRLIGRERLNDNTSPEVNVPGWKVLLRLDSVDVIKFKGKDSRNGGLELILTTRENGEAVMTVDQIDVGTKADSKGSFKITALAHQNYSGEGEFWTLAQMTEYHGQTL